MRDGSPEGPCHDREGCPSGITASCSLDELPEFQRNVLKVLQQPLEEGMVTIARAAVSVTFPSRFMLAAAMNPCPGGYFGDPTRECHCTAPMIQRYVSKISGRCWIASVSILKCRPVKDCSYWT
jgi:Magnesium chelatase, subunit ChlI